MTLSTPLKSILIGLTAIGVAGCPDDGPQLPNFDALPEINRPDTDTAGGDDADANGDQGGNETDSGPIDVPPLDIPDDIPTTPGTVKALQLKAEDAGCDENAIVNIASGETLTAVVVTSPKFDAFTPPDPGGTALDGYFVSDADGGFYSGVLVTIPRADNTDYQPGDQLDLTGELIEFYCQTQLSATTHTKTGDATVIAPIDVPPVQVATEAYEGMLLSVKGVELIDEPNGGVYTATGGFVVSYAFPFFLDLEVGKTYDITGVVMYRFGNYQLVPRYDTDVVGEPAGTDTIEGIQSGTASVDCPPGSQIVTQAENISISGTIVVGKYFVTSSLDAYILSNEQGNEYSGIELTVPVTLNTDWAVGTQMTVTGNYNEFYCLSQFGVNAFEITGSAGTEPAPAVVDFAALVANPEPWEGVVVTVSNVTVDSVNQFNQGDLNGSGVLIDDRIMGNDFPDPLPLETYTTLTGVVGWAFDAVRISPRYAADMNTDPVADPTPEASETAEVVEAAEMVEDAGPTDAAEAAPETVDDAVDAGAETVDDAGPDVDPDAPADAAQDAETE